MADVQIKSKSTIKPAGKTWKTDTISLTEWDMIVGKGHVPSVYFYRPAEGWARSTVVDTLKESLATALGHFYPLAGRIHRTERGRIEVVLDESSLGAELVEADTEMEMAEFGDFSEGETFQHLIPAVDYRKPTHQVPVLQLQLTFFRCAGFSLGMTISRAVADGLASLHFLREWARIARGEPMEAAAVHDRTLLRAGEPPRGLQCPNLESVPPPPLPPVMIPPLFPDPGDLHQPNSNMVMKETTMVMLPLTNLQMDRLKQMANKDNDIGIHGRRSYSRVEALTAHIWRCGSRARGHEGEKLNSIGVAIDARSRITPPLPPTYFGNAVIMITATSSSEELNSKPLGYACYRVRRAINTATEEYVWKDLEYWKHQDDLRVWRGLRTTEGMYVNPDVIVSSWFTLPLYDLDFGWGNETHMAPGDQTMEGVFMILPGRQDGSALVAVCLKPLHVHTFKDYFYNQINCTRTDVL